MRVVLRIQDVISKLKGAQGLMLGKAKETIAIIQDSQSSRKVEES